MSGTPYGPPEAPSQLSGAVDGLSITWTWEAPDDGCGGCGIKSYSVTDIGEVGANSAQKTYDNYSTLYCVTVSAQNNLGITGPESEQSCATTGPEPPPP